MNGNGFGNNGNEDYIFTNVTKNGRKKTRGWSIAAMVSGILSVICCVTGYASIALGVVAIVLAILARRNLGYFDGMAVTGLILGIIGFVLGVAIIIAVNLVDEAFLDKMKSFFEVPPTEDAPSNGSEAEV
jgi:hypothetical protein